MTTAFFHDRTAATVFRLAISLLVIMLAVACRHETMLKDKSAETIVTDSDTARIDRQLRQYEAAGETDKGMLREILSASIKAEYNDRACDVLLRFAEDYAADGKFDSALHYFNRARDYCNKPVFDSTLPALYLTHFGAFYHGLKSDNVAANNSYYKALNYLETHNLAENELTINIYLNLFATQERLGYPQQALAYLEKADALAKKLNSVQALIAVHTQLGNYYAEREDFKKAQRFFDLAVSNAEANWNGQWHPNIFIAALVGKASVLTKTGSAETAVPLLQKAIGIAKKHNIIYSEVTTTIELGLTLNRLSRFKEAILMVVPALRIQEQQGFNWYREEGYRVLMEAYKGIGDYQLALVYSDRMNAFNDSLENTEKTVALNELELKFQTAKKDREIAAKQLLIEQQKNKLARKNVVISGITVAAVLVLLVLIILYRNTAHKRNIQALELATMRREQEIDLLRSTMKGEEQERKRLSRELHDGIGSMISSAIMRLSLLKKQSPAAVSARDYDEVLGLLKDTGSEVRRTAQNLMPDILHKQTLSEAIRNYCETIASGTGLKITTQFFGDDTVLSPDSKLVIYRIVQELVHNIVKHSRATGAIVQGVIDEEQFAITVEDNGTGFDISGESRGMGLKNVASRVKSLYGIYNIESTPGGTTVYIEFDMKRM